MEKPEGKFDLRPLYRKLALEAELDGVDLRVCLYLFSKLDFENYTRIEQLEIAEALGRRKEHVSRSLRKLKAKEIIIEGSPRVGRSPALRINPKYAK